MIPQRASLFIEVLLPCHVVVTLPFWAAEINYAENIVCVGRYGEHGCLVTWRFDYQQLFQELSLRSPIKDTFKRPDFTL